MVLIGNDNGRMRDNDFKFPSPCGDYGSYQKEAIRYHIEHMDEFPSPCGDYGSYQGKHAIRLRYRRKSFRPLAGIMVLITLTTEHEMFVTSVVSVPLRGLWFLSLKLNGRNVKATT